VEVQCRGFQVWAEQRFNLMDCSESYCQECLYLNNRVEIYTQYLY
jgi:hypothetical protein